MALYDSKAPGVYIEEKSGGPRPIQAVGTSTAAFLGVAPKPDAPKEPKAINNWTEFKKIFCPADPQPVLGDEYKDHHLARAVFGFFQNGGTRCYVVNLGNGGSLRTGLGRLKRYDDIAIVAAPGYSELDDYSALIEHCEEVMKDRVAILDAPSNVDDIDNLKEAMTVDGPGLKPPPSSYAAFYYPWIQVRDPLLPPDKNGGPTLWAPPSGHIAGIWARSDAKRGVHKAPANEPIRDALGIKKRLTDDEQGGLNQAGVNCIRYFSNEGIMVWGARTLQPDGEWRYINVRRLFNMIEESIVQSTRWIVFEPNDEALWKAIRRDVTAFLTRIWRTGALMGSTAEQSFFVKCDAETNPPEEIDAGKVTIVIGIAPVKPAEFVVFQISQLAAGAQIAES